MQVENRTIPNQSEEVFDSSFFSVHCYFFGPFLNEKGCCFSSTCRCAFHISSMDSAIYKSFSKYQQNRKLNIVGLRKTLADLGTDVSMESSRVSPKKKIVCCVSET